MEEIFKDIPWYEWLYQAGTLGNIKSLDFGWNWKEGILKNRLDKYGYWKTFLYKNSSVKCFKTHRLIILTFKWKSKLEVNHKNWIKDDNRLKNLEWCTREYNQKHRFDKLWHKWTWTWKFWKLHPKSKEYQKNKLA